MSFLPFAHSPHPYTWVICLLQRCVVAKKMCTPNTTISKLQTPTPQSGIIRETEKSNSKTLDNRRKKTKPKQILAAPGP